MPQLFSQDQPKTFRCLNCGEVINTSMTECLFCGVSLTPEAAMATAVFQENFDKACTDARDLKIMSLALMAFYPASWIPIVGQYATMGFLGLTILTPIMLARWWFNYHRIQTSEDSYKKAQRNIIIAVVIWSLVAGVWVLVSVIQLALELQKQFVE